MLRKKAAWSCSRFYLGNLFRVLWLVQCILLHDVETTLVLDFAWVVS